MKKSKKLTKITELSIIFISILLFSFNSSAQNNSPDKVGSEVITSEFVTDGCTGFPDGNYYDCCVQHDREYYAGGSGKERWRSDKKLFLCVAAKPQFYNKLIAPIIWLGVRVGGVSWLKASFSWGFGKNKAYLKKINKKKNLPAKNTD